VLNQEPRYLRTFVAVVEHGSMTRAAEALGFVPSAVSQHVAALERRVGAELLVRRPGSQLSVTPAGRMLVDAAYELFSHVRAFEDVARRVGGQVLVEMRLGTYATAMCHLLPAVLAELRVSHPQLVVETREVESPDALPLLRAGTLDAVLGYRYVPSDLPVESGEWAIVPVAEEPLLFVTAGSRPAIAYDDLLDHDWVIGYPQGGDRLLLERWAAAQGRAPRVRHVTRDPHASLAMVAAGLAVTLAPFSTVEASLRGGGRLRVVATPPGAELTRSVALVTRQAFQPPSLAELAEGLRAAAARMLARPLEGAARV
jgi:DNA-binding transcriptional LysR family regulator